MPRIRLEIVTHDWDRFDELLDLSYAELYGPFGVARDGHWYHPAHGSEFAVALAENDIVAAAAADSAFTGELLGSARLLPAAGEVSRQVRQVAVAPAARGTGVGRALMLALEEIAAREGASDLWLNARSSAYGFYERLGYVAEGDEFTSALTGILHRTMRKHLTR